MEMREITRRKLIDQARQQAEQNLAQQVYLLLNKRYKAVGRDLRRANLRKRVTRNLKTDNILLKDDDLGWPEWIEFFTHSLEQLVVPVIENVQSIEIKYWQSRNILVPEVDPQIILANSQLRLGRQLREIGQDTRDSVLSSISQWYNSDVGLPELIAGLRSLFSEARADSISRTESGYLSSSVAYETMRKLGILWWNWDLGPKRGIFPCPICVGQAKRNPHRIGDKMPPDGSHPGGCRCGVSYASADGSRVILIGTEL